MCHAEPQANHLVLQAGSFALFRMTKVPSLRGAPATAAKDSSLRGSASDRGNLPVRKLRIPLVHQHNRGFCHAEPQAKHLVLQAGSFTLFRMTKVLSLRGGASDRGKGFVVARERQRPRQRIRRCEGAPATAAKDSSLRGSASDRGNLPVRKLRIPLVYQPNRGFCHAEPQANHLVLQAGSFTLFRMASHKA